MLSVGQQPTTYIVKKRLVLQAFRSSVYLEGIFFYESITMFNNVRRIFLFDKNSLNSSSSDTASTSSTRITNTTDPSTSTIHDSSVDSGISSPLDQFEIIPLIPMHRVTFISHSQIHLCFCY